MCALRLIHVIEGIVLNLKEVLVRPVYPSEEQCFQERMQTHHCRIPLNTPPILVALKDGDILFPQFWPLPPAQSCVEFEDIRPYLIGPTALARRPESVSTAVVKKADISFPASASSVML